MPNPKVLDGPGKAVNVSDKMLVLVLKSQTSNATLFVSVIWIFTLIHWLLKIGACAVCVKTVLLNT